MMASPGAPGTGPPSYQPPFHGFTGRFIWPLRSTPTGSTGRWTLIEEMRIVAGGEVGTTNGGTYVMSTGFPTAAPITPKLIGCAGTKRATGATGSTTPGLGLPSLHAKATVIPSTPTRTAASRTA